MENLNGENTNGLIVEGGNPFNDTKTEQTKPSIEDRLIDAIDTFNILFIDYIRSRSRAPVDLGQVESHIRAYVEQSLPNQIAAKIEETCRDIIDAELEVLPWDEILDNHLDTSEISRNVVETINDDPEAIEDAVKEVVNSSMISVNSFEIVLR